MITELPDFKNFTDADWATLASDLRKKAAEHRQARQESIERSDTDGFLSQWAHGLNVDVLLTQAEIADKKGYAEFYGLYDGDRRVGARIKTIKGHFGKRTVWELAEDEAEKYSRKYIPFGPNSRVQKNLLLTERKEIAPAWCEVQTVGGGNAMARVYRLYDPMGRDSIPFPIEENHC